MADVDIPCTKLVIVKTGEKLRELDQVDGDFEHWILRGMQFPSQHCQVVAVHEGQALPEADRVSGVVVTGSPAMVTDHSDWIERSASWLREVTAQHVPVLGICFGHQLLAYALGGEVGHNTNGIEVGTVILQLHSPAQNDKLFRGLPQSLGVHASHRQAVLKLPPDAQLLASSAQDPHLAFRVGDNAWGLQFHPEFTARITRSYVAYYQRREAGNKRSGTSLSTTSCYDTPFGGEFLRRFAQVVEERFRVGCPLDAR